MKNDQCKTPTIETSPLLRAMDKALKKAGGAASGIRISITSTGEWYAPEGGQERAFVKWLCWNLVSENGGEISEPEYCVVHGGLDPAEFESNLQANFPDQTVTIDNEIEME